MVRSVLHHDSSNHAQIVRNVLRGTEPGQFGVDELTLQSWRRCEELGLDPGDKPEIVILERNELQQRRDRCGRLLDIARSEMTNLYQQVAGSGHAIILTDSDGVVLNYIGDPQFSDTAAYAGMRTGAVWSEAVQGTNGMGTCLVEKKPLVIHRGDHFFTSNGSLTCSAAPIFDPHGTLLAVLDASCESSLAQRHTMVLLNISAQVIENRAFFCGMQDAYIMRFHSRADFVSTFGEGAIAFDSDGSILAANRSAGFQLGLNSPQQLVGKKIHELFNASLRELIDHPTRHGFGTVPVRETGSGRRFFAAVQPPQSDQMARPARHNPVSRRVTPRNNDGITLDDLHHGNARFAKCVETAKRVIDKGIPFLLLGETGVGKEMFARALHNSSARRERPFVAVDCASLPESLIESELFGYQPGAFTGASRDGNKGKIIQADGGTLFLDEIGDMSIHLQARLLRVLEQREVTPLGGGKPIPVDISLISATHRDIPSAIDAGNFRQDLYYRLNGITLSLPPLRNRTDRIDLIKSVAQNEYGGSSPLEWDKDALGLLDSYEWPGNLRQLRNVVRVAVAMSVDGRITVDDLPEEFRRIATDAKLAEDPDQEFNSLNLAVRDALVAELEDMHWNIRRVAQKLGLSRNTLYRRMKRYGIKAPR